MRLFFTPLFVSERKQIAMIADEKSPARISHRSFATKSLRNEDSMDNLAIRVEDVCKVYKLYDKPSDRLKDALGLVRKNRFKEHHALKHVSFEVKKGETIGIIGTNGSGKSTLIRLIMKELEPTEGTIIVNGQNLKRMKHRNIAKYRRGIGVVFQDFRLLKDRNIYENIAFALRVTETPTRVIKRKVPAALSLVGLAQKYKAFPKELSGGEQQRVAIARAIVNEPAILLADEPTGNLDPTNSWEIMSLLKEANDRGTTVLVVTHNQEIVNEMNERVITMKQGVIVSDEQKGGYIDED